MRAQFGTGWIGLALLISVPSAPLRAQQNELPAITAPAPSAGQRQNTGAIQPRMTVPAKYACRRATASGRAATDRSEGTCAPARSGRLISDCSRAGCRKSESHPAPDARTGRALAHVSGRSAPTAGGHAPEIRGPAAFFRPGSARLSPASSHEPDRSCLAATGPDGTP